MSNAESVGAYNFYIEKQISKAPLHNMHHHRSYELYFMVLGECEYFIEDHFYRIREGDLVLIPLNVFHRTAGEGGLRYLVRFSEKYLEKYYTSDVRHPMLEELPSVFRPEDFRREQVLLLLDRPHREYAKECGDERLMAGCLYQLLFVMIFENNSCIPENHGD